MTTDESASRIEQADNPESDQAQPLYQDLATAVIFITIGVAAFVAALSYPIGNLHRTGAGLFPLLVSGVMSAIGVALLILALAGGRWRAALRSVPAMMPAFSTVRALIFVMLSLLAFALLVRPAGLFIATAVLTFISTRAERGRAVVGSLVLSVISAGIAALIFVFGIGLPIPLWP